MAGRDLEQGELGVADRREAGAVQGARAELGEGFEVLGRAVSFVTGESIVWVLPVEVLHELVAGDLGEDTGGGDAEAEGVAVDDGGVGETEVRDRQAIDEDGVGGRVQSQEGFPHGAVRGLQDVQGVDRLDVDGVEAIAEARQGAKRGVEAPALRGGELLRVRQSLERRRQSLADQFNRKHDRGGDDRSCERTPAGFVDARDVLGAPACALTFKGEEVLATVRGAGWAFRVRHGEG